MWKLASRAQHALLVIAHLQSVLDHERGEEAAKHLTVLFCDPLENCGSEHQATPAALEELINLYGGVRQAWYQAGQQCRWTNNGALNRHACQHFQNACRESCKR